MHTRTYEVQGKKWFVDPWGLIIPRESIEGMTSGEIGEHVISMMEKTQEIRENEENWYFYPAASSSLPREQRDSRYAALVERDGNTCQVPTCLHPGPYDIDHIIPRSGGGSNKLDNLHLLCRQHNLQKKEKSWEVFLAEVGE